MGSRAEGAGSVKITVEIVIDEREWWAAHRKQVGPFLELDSATLLDSLSDTVMAWTHGVPSAVHVNVPCADSSRSHGDGGCCEPMPTQGELAMEKRLKALETWAARANGRFAFHEDDYLECPDMESVRDRLSDLESRLPASG